MCSVPDHGRKTPEIQDPLDSGDLQRRAEAGLGLVDANRPAVVLGAARRDEPESLAHVRRFLRDLAVPLDCRTGAHPQYLVCYRINGYESPFVFHEESIAHRRKGCEGQWSPLASAQRPLCNEGSCHIKDASL